MTVQHTQGQRIKAAKELGGFASLDDLARAVGLDDLSPKSLRRCANDQRTARPHELVAIARVCRISPAFFAIDLSVVVDGPPGAGEVAERELMNSGRVISAVQRVQLMKVPHHGGATAVADEIRAVRLELSEMAERLSHFEARLPPSDDPERADELVDAATAILEEESPTPPADTGAGPGRQSEPTPGQGPGRPGQRTPAGGRP